MIKVYFPPGCYGTYLSRCIYNYTNLRKLPFINFKFGDNGDSHQHRQNVDAETVIQQGHFETLSSTDIDQIITILPCENNRLDYYNNQFFKQEHGHLINYILGQISQNDAEHKLKTQWNYSGEFNNEVPRWIMREWCSFWINDVLDTSYNTTKYLKLNSVVQIFTKDIFENYIETLNRIVLGLQLTITVDTAIINKHHKEFLALQKFHNSQNRCQQYVADLLAGRNNEMVLQSIFDEAYIQHLLRQHNLEIQCDGLNIFPNTIQHLKNLTYETSNNCNSGRG